MASFAVLDYLVFVLLLASSSLIGIYFWYKSRNNATNAEFLTGNRQLGLFPVTMSLIAGSLSTNSLLGYPAEVFQVGTQLAIKVVAIAISMVVCAELFMPIYHNMGLLSINEYLAQRFKSEKLRMAGVIGFILCTTPYMAVILYGPAVALSSVTPMSIPTSIVTVGAVCTVYTAIGGIKAVVWTDVLQGILMFAGLALVIIQGAIEMGGFGEIWRINKEGGRLKLFNTKFDLYNHDNMWNVLIGSLVTWGAQYCATQTSVQRFCSMGSVQKARKCLYFNMPGLIILVSMAIACGMVIFAKYHACDPVTLGIIKRHDQLMPHFVAETLSHLPGLTGLFVACMFSGALSSLSSGFNSLAAVTWEDLIKPRVNVSEKRALTISKIIACTYGVLAIALSFAVGSIGSVYQAFLVMAGSLWGPMYSLFLLGILFPYATAPGCLIGFSSGVGASLFIAIGSMIYPRPKVSMPTSVDSCPAQLIQDIVAKYGSLPTTKFIPYYENPEGSALVFHLSYLLIALFGFLVCLIVGALCSLCIGDWRTIYNRKLMTPSHKYLFPWISSTDHKENNNQVANEAKVYRETNC